MGGDNDHFAKAFLPKEAKIFHQARKIFNPYEGPVKRFDLRFCDSKLQSPQYL